MPIANIRYRARTRYPLPEWPVGTVKIPTRDYTSRVTDQIIKTPYYKDPLHASPIPDEFVTNNRLQRVIPMPVLTSPQGFVVFPDFFNALSFIDLPVVTVPAGTIVYSEKVSAQGIIAWLEFEGNYPGLQPIIMADSAAVFSLTPAHIQEFLHEGLSVELGRITFWDDVANIYRFVVAPKIKFASSIQVGCYNPDAADHNATTLTIHYLENTPR